MSRPGRLALAALVVPALAVLVVAARGEDPLPKALLSATFDWNDVKVEPTKVGAVRRFFALPGATMREVECHVTTLNVGEAPHPPHRHPEEELMILREGTLESFIEGKTRRLGPGSVIFHASNELHGVRNVGDGPATYHVVKWSVGGADKPKL